MISQNSTIGCLLFTLAVATAAGGCTTASSSSTETAYFQNTATFQLASQFQRQIVSWDGPPIPGTIVVDTSRRFLYFVLPRGQAIRYGVGVARDGFRWTGIARVGRKADWPAWVPPKEMIEREPQLAIYSDGMPGGIDNPLGARALYLYDGNGRDTLYRLHGTNEPWSIGEASSSGCIRMLNEDIIDLYQRVEIGAEVYVL